MSIAGEYETFPSWVAGWPHCCDFGADTCDMLRWSAMVRKALKSQQNAPFYRIVWPGLYGAFKVCCDALKSHAMCCDRKFSIFNIFLPILEYLRYLLYNFQTVFQHCAGNQIPPRVICASKLLVEFLKLPSQQ